MSTEGADFLKLILLNNKFLTRPLAVICELVRRIKSGQGILQSYKDNLERILLQENHGSWRLTLVFLALWLIANPHCNE